MDSFTLSAIEDSTAASSGDRAIPVEPVLFTHTPRLSVDRSNSLLAASVPPEGCMMGPSLRLKPSQKPFPVYISTSPVKITAAEDTTLTLTMLSAETAESYLIVVKSSDVRLQVHAASSLHQLADQAWASHVYLRSELPLAAVLTVEVSKLETVLQVEVPVVVRPKTTPTSQSTTTHALNVPLSTKSESVPTTGHTHTQTPPRVRASAPIPTGETTERARGPIGSSGVDRATTPPRRELRVRPSDIMFPPAGPSQPAVRSFHVRNVSARATELSCSVAPRSCCQGRAGDQRLVHGGSDAFKVLEPKRPVIIQPDESTVVTVEFFPRELHFPMHGGKVVLRTNANGSKGAFQVPLLGFSGRPRLSFYSAGTEQGLGSALWLADNEGVVTIRNEGTADAFLQCRASPVTQGSFVVHPGTCVVPAGKDAQLRVRVDDVDPDTLHAADLEVEIRCGHEWLRKTAVACERRCGDLYTLVDRLAPSQDPVRLLGEEVEVVQFRVGQRREETLTASMTAYPSSRLARSRVYRSHSPQEAPHVNDVVAVMPPESVAPRSHRLAYQDNIDML